MTAEDLVALARKAILTTEAKCWPLISVDKIARAVTRTVVEACAEEADRLSLGGIVASAVHIARAIRALAPVEAHEGPSQGSEEKERQG